MKWIVAYVNGGMDSRSNPEGNVPERKDGYGASPISLTVRGLAVRAGLIVDVLCGRSSEFRKHSSLNL